MRTAIVAILLAVAVILGTPSSGYAVEPDEVLSDPALEHRARRLSAELRCMVCQNQSIDDSNAPLARDLRLLVRERLKTGATDDEVRAFLVARYGEFVLLKPPLSTGTILLWLTPLIVLGAVGALVISRVRRVPPSPATAGAPALSDDERKRVEAILARDGDKS